MASDETGRSKLIERGALAVGMFVGALAASIYVHLLAGPIGAYAGAVAAGVGLEEVRKRV